MVEIKNNNKPGFDIIGDIHGYVEPLRGLLGKLGYMEKGGYYSNPEGRRVIFLGDYIDRGPGIRETLHLVKNMVDSGGAFAVMGNHEYNAVCYCTPDGNGGYLRPHEHKNDGQIKETLKAFADREEEWAMWIDWFKSLPFFLELDGLRAVHASWDDSAVDYLKGKSLLDEGFLNAGALKGSREFNAIETVLKGVEIPLPVGECQKDKDGTSRPNIRVRWWESPVERTYREIVFPENNAVSDSPIDFTRVNAWEGYEYREPPVFVGHYWLPSERKLAPLSPNVACLDYSVAGQGGKLVAYRWDGENQLDESKFVEHSANEADYTCSKP